MVVDNIPVALVVQTRSRIAEFNEEEYRKLGRHGWYTLMLATEGNKMANNCVCKGKSLSSVWQALRSRCLSLTRGDRMIRDQSCLTTTCRNPKVQCIYSLSWTKSYLSERRRANTLQMDPWKRFSWVHCWPELVFLMFGKGTHPLQTWGGDPRSLCHPQTEDGRWTKNNQWATRFSSRRHWPVYTGGGKQRKV